LQVRTKVLHKANSYFFRPFLLFDIGWLLVSLPESSGGRVRNFPLSISFHHGSPCSPPWKWTIRPLVAAVLRRSLTPSTWSSSTNHTRIWKDNTEMDIKHSYRHKLVNCNQLVLSKAGDLLD
jgi:hypothetical protein